MGAWIGVGFFINILFPIYYCFFGFIMLLSFCNMKVITEQFLFLKTTLGRGYFNIFISGLFIAQSGFKHLAIWSWINLSLFLACGIFFLVVGYCYPQVTVKEID